MKHRKPPERRFEHPISSADPFMGGFGEPCNIIGGDDHV